MNINNAKGESFEANDSWCDSVDEKLLRKDGQVEKPHKREKDRWWQEDKE